MKEKKKKITLTEQWESNPKDEDHDTTKERQQEITCDHDTDNKQSWILPFETFDGGLVFSSPHRPCKDQSHHSSSQKHAEGI